MFDSIIHFLKHLIGLCGEPHPSLLMGGFGIVGYCIHYLRQNKNRRKK